MPSVARFAADGPSEGQMASEVAFADTNLFLRYLTNDLPEQADAVERLLDRAASGEVVLATTPLVIAEIVWTLESFYEQPRESTREMVIAVLNTPGLQVKAADEVLQAIVWYAEKRVDFVDAYHAAWMLAEDVSTAYTFDRKHFSRFENLTVLPPG